MHHRLLLIAWTLAVVAACGSEPAPEGVGKELDVEGLTDEVFQLCERGCYISEFTETGCKFFVRHDLLTLARLAEDPKACFDLLRGAGVCALDVGSCSDDRCALEDVSACVPSGPPSVELPAGLQPVEHLCEAEADCRVENTSFSEPEVSRQRIVARCRADVIARTEIWLVDRGAVCAHAYIDWVACRGLQSQYCVPRSEGCLTEMETYQAECNGEAQTAPQDR